MRYSQKQKDEVVKFVVQYNQEHGRGGQSAACKKWKMNPITIRSWLDKASVATPSKSAKKKRPRVVKPKSSVSNAPASTVENLTRMAEIQKEIQLLQNEYESLKSRI